MFLAACDCFALGSTSLQCDRRTGQCPCLPGIEGSLCDRCHYATSGSLPDCKPCGACFHNYEAVLKELSGVF